MTLDARRGTRLLHRVLARRRDVASRAAPSRREPRGGRDEGDAAGDGKRGHPSRSATLALLVATSSAAGLAAADPTGVEPDGATSSEAEPAALAALDLSAHAGKVVYVDFWASWCTPCRASFPWMNALQEELGEDGFVVLGVNTGDDPEAAARFLDEVPAGFEIVYDGDGAIAQAYGVQGMPMAYVHDRSGELVASHVGFNDALAEERGVKIRALVSKDR